MRKEKKFRYVVVPNKLAGKAQAERKSWFEKWVEGNIAEAKKEIKAAESELEEITEEEIQEAKKKIKAAEAWLKEITDEWKEKEEKEEKKEKEQEQRTLEAQLKSLREALKSFREALLEKVKDETQFITEQELQEGIEKQAPAFFGNLPEDREKGQGYLLSELCFAIDFEFNAFFKESKQKKKQKETSPFISFRRSYFLGAAIFERSRFSGEANFKEAWFSEGADFRRAKFSGAVDFEKTRFSGEAYFWRAQFSGAVDFEKARFSGKANFRESWFIGKANFTFSRFSEKVNFTFSRFSEKADFWRSRFIGEADFTASWFSEAANFRDSQFSGEADFSWSRFSGEVDFCWSEFSGEANFSRTEFSKGADFKKRIFEKKADFKQAQFYGEVEFHEAVFKAEVDFTRAVFKALTPPAAWKAQFSGSASPSKEGFAGKADFKEQTPEPSEKEAPSRVVFTNAHFNTADAVNFASCTFEGNVYFDFEKFNPKASFNFDSIDLPADKKLFFRDGVLPARARRDGARLLKKYFDEQKDYALADHFYRLEMDARLKAKTGLVEKVLLWVGKITSDFSQNWFLPLLWYLVLTNLFHNIVFAETSWREIGFIYTATLILFWCFLGKKRFLRNWELCVILFFPFTPLFSLGSSSVDYADFANPLRLFTDIPLKLHESWEKNVYLFSRAVGIGLIYQFVVALKRKTRRR